MKENKRNETERMKEFKKWERMMKENKRNEKERMKESVRNEKERE